MVYFEIECMGDCEHCHCLCPCRHIQGPQREKESIIDKIKKIKKGGK